eukprot:jgi/Hompol1/1162/HPOL_004723-RA
MRFLNLLLALVASLFCKGVLGVSWEPEDHELFDLQDTLRELDAAKDFYQLLQIPRTASETEISKAYRIKAKEFHPDKTTDERLRRIHALLTSVATVLKDEKSRERYDKHLARGFPVWRGAGYHYKKYKPGLATVVVFILLAVSAAQLITAQLMYQRNKSRMAQYVEELKALTMAQLRKQLDLSAADVAALPKPRGSLKNASAYEQLVAAGLVHPSQFEVAPPVLSDVAIVQVPLFIVRKLAALLPSAKDGSQSGAARDAASASAGISQADDAKKQK